MYFPPSSAALSLVPVTSSCIDNLNLKGCKNYMISSKITAM